MEKKLIILIKNILDTNQEITLNSKKEDFPEWDSLANLQILSEFEDIFNISIPIEEISNIKKVKDFLKYLK